MPTTERLVYYSVAVQSTLRSQKSASARRFRRILIPKVCCFCVWHVGVCATGWRMVSCRRACRSAILDTNPTTWFQARARSTRLAAATAASIRPPMATPPTSPRTRCGPVRLCPPAASDRGRGRDAEPCVAARGCPARRGAQYPDSPISFGNGTVVALVHTEFPGNKYNESGGPAEPCVESHAVARCTS